uniref:Uncharacterized protein n=1 Tax=Timema shepardi TaxID=629360 RepID=A0A7R9B1B4_TIMSH|nr:unnamed protein product [Timema shepardi]
MTYLFINAGDETDSAPKASRLQEDTKSILAHGRNGVIQSLCCSQLNTFKKYYAEFMNQYPKDEYIKVFPNLFSNNSQHYLLPHSEVYEQGVKEELFLSKYQRSLYNVKRLAAQPWWEPEQTNYSEYFKSFVLFVGSVLTASMKRGGGVPNALIFIVVVMNVGSFLQCRDTVNGYIVCWDATPYIVLNLIRKEESSLACRRSSRRSLSASFLPRELDTRTRATWIGHYGNSFIELHMWEKRISRHPKDVDEWIQVVLRFHKHVSLWQTFLQRETVDEDKLSSV